MDSAVKFSPYAGYLMGLPTNEHHLVFRWNGPGKILFSVCRQGNSASCHFASNKTGLRHLKNAIDEFVEFVFWLFDWCTMVIAKVGKPSIGRLIEKVGFKQFAKSEKGLFYMRPKE